MSRWYKKKEKIPTVPDHSPNIISTLNRIPPPPPPASTDPIIAQDQMQIDVIDAPQNLLDPTKSTAYDQMQVDASLNLMNPTVSNAHHPMQMGISGAGPSFSNPQGSIIASSSTVQEKGQEDIRQGLRKRQRRNWNSTTASIGQNEAFNKVCKFLNDDDVGMVGINGMGGVGKTTLMKKVHKEYLEPSNFKVILVVVSKSIDIDNIQKDIMEGMGLSFDKSGSRHTRAEKINEALDQKKVALLFDDIWEYLGPNELEDIGILGPTGRDTSIFKIIFTTRSEQVCDQMDPDEQIKVECLGWDDSWALFEKSVGRKILESDYEIEPIAKKIAEECKGLPLALTVIGRVMKGKKYRHQWEHALITLQKSSFEDPDTEKQLFARLKLSYDTLPDREKKCFLYCCLFPEDEKIYGDQLIEYWIAEDFLALSGSYLEVSNRGAGIIGTLQAACLLEREDGDMYVKMHDVVRDMGLWIASKLNLNFFIHGDSRLIKSEIEKKWREAGRIYVRRGDGGSQLIKSEIEGKWREAHRIYVRRGDGFPEQPLCPNLTTLIIDLAARERIKIWNSFFNSMGKLRVLKLKNVDFGDEKVEIGQLLELRYLSVCYSNLRILPTDIIKLSKLEVLYLRDNKYFKGAPENSIRHLVELRKLILHINYKRKFNFDAVIVEFGYLSKLEILNMHWYERDESDDGSCEEPKDRVDRVNSVMGQLCDSLRELDMWGWPFAGPGELVSALEQLDKLVFLKISELKFAGVVIFTSGFLPSLKILEMAKCFGLEKIEVSPRAFQNIRKLNISDCFGLKKIEVSPRAFENIRELSITDGFSLKCIVGLEHLRRTLVKLTIGWCVMEELTTAALSFPTLKYMKLRGLLKLKSICSDDVQFPSLTTFHLERCRRLKKLPRGLMNEKRTLTECRIGGDREWWSGLMWQDDGFKSFIDSTLTPRSRKELLSSE